jgi:hypothetical protein
MLNAAEMPKITKIPESVLKKKRHACDHSAGKAEVGGSQIQGQPGLQSEILSQKTTNEQTAPLPKRKEKICCKN